MIPIFILSCQNIKFDIKDAWYNKTNDSSILVTNDSIFYFYSTKSKIDDDEMRILLGNDTIYAEDGLYIISPITNDSIKVINKVNLEVEYEELTPKQRAFKKMRKPVFDEYEEIWIRKK
tara:strand:- start:1251 stop:1607 length:357 start_codon:yes stop_codon:yes gene_type:complete